jgi:hypothetical protein
VKYVAWLLVLSLAAAWGVPRWLLLVLLLLVVASPGLRRLKRAWRSANPGTRPSVTVRGTIEPPTERHAYKPPTTVRALTEALALAELGALTPREDGAAVALGEGGWAAFTAALPERVTQHTVSLEGDSVASIALLCDALARELGPMRLDVDGVELIIDGTRPRGLLLRDVGAAVETHQRRQGPRPPAPSPPRLLH